MLKISRRGFLQKNAFIHHFLRKCNLCLWGTVHCIQLLWFIVYVPCLLLWYHSAANIFKLHVIWSNILKKIAFLCFQCLPDANKRKSLEQELFHHTSQKLHFSPSIHFFDHCLIRSGSQEGWGLFHLFYIRSSVMDWRLARLCLYCDFVDLH